MTLLYQGRISLPQETRIGEDHGYGLEKIGLEIFVGRAEDERMNSRAQKWPESRNRNMEMEKYSNKIVPNACKMAFEIHSFQLFLNKPYFRPYIQVCRLIVVLVCTIADTLGSKNALFVLSHNDVHSLNKYLSIICIYRRNLKLILKLEDGKLFQCA